MLIKNTLHQIELCRVIASGNEYWFSEFRIIIFLYAKIKIGIKLCKDLYIFYSKLILLENMG